MWQLATWPKSTSVHSANHAVTVKKLISSQLFKTDPFRLPLPWFLYAVCFGKPVPVSYNTSLMSLILLISQVSSDGMVCSIAMLFTMLCLVFTSILVAGWKMTKCNSHHFLTHIYWIFQAKGPNKYHNFGTTLRHLWNNFGTTLKQIGDNFGTTLRQLRDIFEATLVQLWDNFATSLRHIWYNFETSLVQPWNNFGTALRQP